MMKVMTEAPAEETAEGKEDMEVYVGIRPEGFIVDPDGKLTCNLESREVMGRDVSIVSNHPESANPIVRSIVDSESVFDMDAGTIKYNIKKSKMFVFNKETEERVFLEGDKLPYHLTQYLEEIKSGCAPTEETQAEENVQEDKE